MEKEVIIKITVNDSKGLILRERVGTAKSGNDSYEMCLLGWNRQGLFVENQKTKNSYSVSWSQFLNAVNRIEEETNEKI